MAKIAHLAGELARSLAGQGRMAVVLGSGFNKEVTLDKYLAHDWRQHEYPFSRFGITVRAIAGHCNSIVLSRWDGVPVVVSRGRVHVYQRSPRALRLWMATILQLMAGDTRMLLTNAVGGTSRDCPEGSVALPTKLFSLFMRSDQYLCGEENEFVAASSVLLLKDSAFHQEAVKAAQKAKLRVNADVTYAAVVGPRYEDRGDIEFFRSQGVATVGMSMTPECDLVAVENADRRRIADAPPFGRRHNIAAFLEPLRVGAVNFVTNNETKPRPSGKQLEHAHVTDIGDRLQPQLSTFLSELIRAHW